MRPATVVAERHGPGLVGERQVVVCRLSGQSLTGAFGHHA